MGLHDVLARAPAGSVEARLARQVDFGRLPAHIAVIMDGNGRWAARRHLARVEGHRAGVDSVRDSVEVCARLGIDVLTLYAFSVENWKRPLAEVQGLMGLLKRYLRWELATLMKNDIRLKVIGSEAELAADIRTDLDAAQERTAGNSGMVFNIALNYSGRAEIVAAARRALRAGVDAEELDHGWYRRRGGGRGGGGCGGGRWRRLHHTRACNTRRVGRSGHSHRTV